MAAFSEMTRARVARCSLGCPSFAALAASLILVASSTASHAQPVPPSEAQSIAKDAYIYSYAMMESYQTWRTQAVDKSANGYVGRVYGLSKAAMTGAWKLPPLQPEK